MIAGRETGPGRDERYTPPGSAVPGIGVQVELDLPGYRDFVVIARGGESVVYRARQEALDRLVAIKVLPAARELGEEDSRRWFQRELEITMRLGQSHPHIVTVLDTRLTGAGEPCIVMEYYELGSLHDQLKARGPLPSSVVVAAGTVIADALAYAHDQGVLHRDVKPQNILVLPTSYVLADFGLARHIGTERSASLELFSYRHAAPQVLDGELPTAADDIYGLASTLYTLLDGRPPFATDDPASDTALAYLRRVRTEPPRPIRAPDAPPELRAIIERGLSRNREDRFPNAGGLRDALANITTEARMWAPGASPPPKRDTVRDPVVEKVPVARSAVEHLDEPPPPPPARDDEATGRRPELDEPTPPKRRSWPRFAWLIGFALLLGAVAGLLGTRLTGDQPDPQPTGRPVPSFTGALPPSASPVANDPNLAPVISAVVDRGDAVELRWTDRSGGQATFIVIQVNNGTGSPVRQVDAGQTTVVIEGLDPAAQGYCYQVLALTDQARAVSEISCTPTR